MSDLVPLSDLITALRSATDSRKSGAFFVTTDSQHSAMITLTSGRITGMVYRHTRGYDAAAALARIRQLKYQSAAEPTELPGEGDLDTQIILRILSTGDIEPSSAGPTTAESSADLDDIRERYVAAIGPIGSALFDEAVEELGDELRTPEGTKLLVEHLAQHIDEEEEAERFRSDATG